MLARSFTLVDMVTPEQTIRLAATLGQITMDKAVVILLAAGDDQPARVDPGCGSRAKRDRAAVRES